MTYSDLKDYIVDTLNNNAEDLGVNVALGKQELVAPCIEVVYYNSGVKTLSNGLVAGYNLAFDLYITIDGSEDNETAMDNLTELAINVIDLFSANIIRVEDSATLGNVFYPDKTTHLVKLIGVYNKYE